MIAMLTGTVAATEANSVVLNVNGIGYRAFVPVSVLSTLPRDGSTVTLHTTMVVRDDDITLYGFLTPDEREIFQALLGVTGVGPKVALSILSVLEAPELARAIAGGDTKTLTRIPGVGAKLAQRLTLELGDHMARFTFEKRVQEAGAVEAPQRAALEDIGEALVNLQYNRADARRAAEQVLTASGGSVDVPRLIRDALNLLSGANRP